MLSKVSFIGFLSLLTIACTDISAAKTNSDPNAISGSSNISYNKQNFNSLDLEDDPKMVGTNVLGFKMQGSTFESVKKRLLNYQFNEHHQSYAGGYLLENDGSGFELEGLDHTQFGFDTDQKLVYVFMQIHESDHLNHTTYNKIVSYIKKNNYKIIRTIDPFVGDRKTEFQTHNNEIIVVESPHMGNFNVYVEYYTKEFGRMRQEAQQLENTQQSQIEAKNF